MKDLKMMNFAKLSKIVTPKDLLWCTSLRWCPPLINQDSLLSVEFSLEQSELVWKLESKDLTTSLVKKMISIVNQFKEPFLWWVEPLNISLMYHAEIPSVWLVLINISSKLVLSQTMLMLITLDLWNIQSPQLLESPLKLKMLKIYPN